MPFWRACTFIFLFFFIQHSALAVRDFPYINITLKQPALEDPYPGMGNNYSSLGGGIDTVLWNPAGLAKTTTMEIYIGLPSAAGSPKFLKNFQVEDIGFDTDDLLKDFTITDSTAGFSAGFIFSDDLNQTGFTTHEYAGHLGYFTIPTGSSYKQALKALDWLTLGVSTHGESGYSIDIAGGFPAQLKLDMDWNNFDDLSGSGSSIKDGIITVVFTPEVGPPITYTTPAAIYSGFLNQDQRIPMTAVFKLHNDLNVQSNLTLTGAGNFGKFYIGANVTPINATANIDDNIKVVFDSQAPDTYALMPNFDPKSQTSIANWVASDKLWGSPEGYDKNSLVKVPAGENLGEFKYQGLLSAQTYRFDLGAMYDISDDLTIGMNFENVTRASLAFKTTGAVAYANYRSLPTLTSDPNTIAGNFTNVTSQTFMIEPEKNVQLPQRLRFGVTLRKPYLLTLDYEFLLTPISFRYNFTSGSKTYTDLIFNDVRFVRAGFEARLFDSPAYVRMGSIFLLTPELIGDDRLTRQTFESMFSYGFYPIKFDIGMRFVQPNYEFGGGAGFSGMSFLSPFSVWWLSTPSVIDWTNKDVASAVAILFPTILTTHNLGDTLNQDFNRIAYFSSYFKRDNWQMTLQNAFDIGATGRAYNTATSRKDVLSWIKWLTTLTISLKF